MPKPNPNAELALHKLGQRLRQGFAKQNPVTERSLDTVRGAIREQQQEQEAARQKETGLDRSKPKDRGSPERDHEDSR